MYSTVFDSYTLPNSLTDTQIRQVFAELSRRNIALAIEWGPVAPSSTCGTSVEGFGSTIDAAFIVNRIKALGGNLQYIAMDEPFFYASLYNGPHACHWTPAQIAQNAVQNIATMKAAFPGLVVGDTEPVLNDADYPGWLNQYAAWVDAWQAATGTPLAFLQSDVDWSMNWRPNVENLRQVLVQRGVPFGMIYDGSDDTSDLNWTRDAELHFTSYETEGGVTPDLVVFQSWANHPQYVLPETTPGSFTYLIDRYFRRRTNFSLAHGSTLIAGALTDTSGQPIQGAPVTLTTVPTSGPGVISNYLLQGTVPASVSSAIIQICVNECGSGMAPADMDVYSFAYVDSSEQKTLNFSNGLAGWAVYGNALIQLNTSSSIKSLHISAPVGLESIVNSLQFAVTSGSAFTVAVQARISPFSVGSGFFSVVFLANGTETSRANLAFAPANLNVGTAQTLNDGSYSFSFVPPNPPEDFELQANFAGSDALWPAFASTPLKTTPAISSGGVVNGANFRSSPLSPGSWLSVFGQNLGDAGHWTNPNTFILGGASVSICGQTAVLSLNSGPLATNGTTQWQINALIPDGILPQVGCPVVVSVNGLNSPPAYTNITPGTLELFGFNSGAGRLPVVTHADYSFVGPTSTGMVPASSGETIIAWGTGDCTKPSVAVGGSAAVVLFSGRVAPGLCQIDFVVPNNLNAASQMTISSSPDTYILWLAAR